MFLGDTDSQDLLPVQLCPGVLTEGTKIKEILGCN
jgi:hypothetical protein